VMHDLLDEVVADRFASLPEGLLIERASIHPAFGWGVNGNFMVTDVEGNIISVPDGFWVIALGTSGLFGLVAIYTALLLPSTLLALRVKSWMWSPAMVGAAIFAVLLPHGGGAHEARSLFTIPLLLGALGFFVFRIIQDIKRLHDIGASGGWIVCAFIPVISLVYIVILLFRDGEPMTNTYGPDPKGRGSDLDADAVADVFR